MQAALHGESGLVVQEVGEPVVVFENQIAGEKNRMWKLPDGFLRKIGQFFCNIGSITAVGNRRHSILMAEVDKIA